MAKIAVIGSGISGLTSAYLLSQDHQVTVYEANDYLGGHTHTHAIELEGRQLAVDTVSLSITTEPTQILFACLINWAVPGSRQR